MTVPGGPMPALSCYSTTLVAALRGRVPDPALRLALAVRLRVLDGRPDGVLAFSHHDRIDAGPGGRRLSHRSAASWPAAAAGLAAALERGGPVIAVGNTATMPWAPSSGGAGVPHWLLIDAHHDGHWHVRDSFEALLPHGEHRPYAGRLDDAALRSVLTPCGPLPVEVGLRDRYALGAPVPAPAATHYRWLVWEAPGLLPVRIGGRAPVPPPVRDDGGGRPGVLEGTAPVLSRLARRLGEDPAALARHADDLWAAARHHQHRLGVLAGAGLLPAAPAARAADAWGELPRALRFALASAERGRPRPALVARACEAVIDAMSHLTPEETPR
ncbi:hypothetical protein ACGFX7_01085 [Streptomyces harbinensis]|uniref:hypothetical protein n=1 Tax=Streptomyces harbinensis TaxID=1176198 RepID=UPI003723206A